MPSRDLRATSILRMILASLSFSVMAIFVKAASKTVPSMEIVFVRSVIGMFAIILLIWKNGAPWLGNNPKIMMLRGIFGFSALAMHFYAISHLNLATAVILNYTAPIFVVVFARFILKEKTSWPVKVALLASFVGLFLLASPQFQVKPFPILIGILSGIFAALAYIMIRFGGENESSFTIIFYFAVVSTIGSFPLMLSDFHWPNSVEWIPLIVLSIGALLGQLWLTKSIQGAPVSFVLPFSYLTPVFASLAGVFVWKEYLKFQSVIGGLIIIVSGIVIYLFRQRTTYIPIEE